MKFREKAVRKILLEAITPGTLLEVFVIGLFMWAIIALCAIIAVTGEVP